MGRRGGRFNAEKRRKELKRKKKQDDKRNKRLGITNPDDDSPEARLARQLATSQEGLAAAPDAVIDEPTGEAGETEAAPDEAEEGAVDEAADDAEPAGEQE